MPVPTDHIPRASLRAGRHTAQSQWRWDQDAFQGALPGVARSAPPLLSRAGGRRTPSGGCRRGVLRRGVRGERQFVPATSRGHGIAFESPLALDRRALNSRLTWPPVPSATFFFSMGDKDFSPCFKKICPFKPRRHIRNVYRCGRFEGAARRRVHSPWGAGIPPHTRPCEVFRFAELKLPPWYSLVPP